MKMTEQTEMERLIEVYDTLVKDPKRYDHRSKVHKEIVATESKIRTCFVTERAPLYATEDIAFVNGCFKYKDVYERVGAYVYMERRTEDREFSLNAGSGRYYNGWCENRKLSLEENKAALYAHLSKKQEEHEKSELEKGKQNALNVMLGGESNTTYPSAFDITYRKDNTFSTEASFRANVSGTRTDVSLRFSMEDVTSEQAVELKNLLEGLAQKYGMVKSR
jgi:hypothetical protein